MKKLLIFLLFPFAIYGQMVKTDAALTTEANVIKNETSPGLNTPLRIGTMHLNEIASKVNTAYYAGVTTSGTDTYTATIIPNIVAYSSFFSIKVKFGITNTGPATLNLNGVGAKPIKKLSSGSIVSLEAGDLVAGWTYWIVYDGTTNFQLMGGASSGGGGGITNSAGVDEFMLSNGINAVPSGVFSAGGTANIQLGNGSLTGHRIITSANLASDANLILNTQGWTRLGYNRRNVDIFTPTSVTTFIGGGGQGVLGMYAAQTIPTTSVTAGGVLYVDPTANHLSYWTGTTAYDLIAGGVIALNNGHVLIGNGSNVATDRSVSGDVLITNTGTTTIQSNAVTLGKMAALVANSVIGNNTGGSATPFNIGQVDLTAMINPFSSSLSGTVPASGGGTTNFMRADGTWAAPGGSGTVSSIATTSPITGGTITTTGTIGINNAAADGSTKGAASFTTADFDASSGNISLDYTNGQKATGSVPGFLSATDWTTFNSKLGTSLSAGHLFVGNGSNVATDVALSGDGTMSSAGALSVTKILGNTIPSNALGVLTNDGAGTLTWGTGSKVKFTAVKTANYPAVAYDGVPCDDTGGGFTVTLPTAPLDGTLVYVKRTTTVIGNTVSIVTGGSDVFNRAGGATTATLTLPNQGFNFLYKATGAIWYVTADDLPLSQLDARYAALYLPLNFSGLSGVSTVDLNNDVLPLNQSGTTVTVSPNKLLNPPHTTKTANYTAALVDVGTSVFMRSVSSLTFTVPKNSTAAIPIDSRIAVKTDSTGSVTFVPEDATVTLNNPGTLVNGKKGTYVVLVKTKLNTWDVTTPSPVSLLSSDVTGALGYTPVTNARTIAGNALSADISATTLRASLGQYEPVTLSSDQTSSTSAAADCGNLQFTVGTTGVYYEFKVIIYWSSSNTSEALRLGVTGPTLTDLVCRIDSHAGATSAALNVVSAYDAANTGPNTSLLTDNIAIMTGRIKCSATGTFKIRYWCRTGTTTVTALTGSKLEWRLQ